MTTITIATVEATIRNRLMNNGTVMVRIGDETMNQMNEIIAELRAASGFNEDALTDDDLEFAMSFSGNFNNSSIGTKVVDGFLAPEEAAIVEEALVAIREDLKEAPAGMLLPVILVNKVLNAERCFAL